MEGPLGYIHRAQRFRAGPLGELTAIPARSWGKKDICFCDP